MIAFFTEKPIAAGAHLLLDGDAAQHARVRRVAVGDLARVTDGRGRMGSGTIVTIGKSEICVGVETVRDMPAPTALEILVPVADRDRMLWAAEKCVELQVTAWQPVYFARSRSVSPRGEGPKFQDKVRARMQSALEQSAGAWLPAVRAEMAFEEMIARATDSQAKLLLDAGGAPILSLDLHGPAAIAVGPEGGLAPDEISRAKEAGWQLASLGSTTLRFETAAVAAVAAVRAAQLASRGKRRVD